jgi:O-methyltransferase involved in polyketide biosynthesis
LSVNATVSPDVHDLRRSSERPEPGRLGPVSKTLVIPLWARATEARKRRPLVRDAWAADIYERLDYDFSVFRRAYGSQIGFVLRGLLYDWVDVDLPDVMALRRTLFEPSSRRRGVSGSIVERSTLAAVAREGRAPYFFVSEGCSCTCQRET